jgi:hypothetical protein
MIAWWVGLAAACDPAATLAAAEVELAGLDLGAAEASLKRLEEELGCGYLSSEQVFRLHAAEGVLAALRRADDDASASFVAARRLGPMPDMAPFGGSVAAAWIDAVEPTGTGTLSFEPALGRAWTVWVDGARSAAPVVVPAGLHVVQVGASRDDVRFGRVVWVADGDLAVLAAGLPEAPGASTAPRSGPRVSWLAAVGAQLAFGPARALTLDGEARSQASARVAAPVEVGVSVSSGALWARGVAVLAPQLNGRLVYATGDGVPGATAWAWGADAGGGARWGRFGLGLTAGARLPSRLSARLVAPIGLVEGWSIEPAVGVYAPTSGSVEPLAGLSLRVGQGG